MSDRIGKELIEHVAKLASLSLTPAEVETMTHEIAAIVGFIDELAALDTSGVPPTAHVQLERTAWRADEEVPCLSHEDALAAAPRVSEGGFAVPTFVQAE